MLHFLGLQAMALIQQLKQLLQGRLYRLPLTPIIHQPEHEETKQVMQTRCLGLIENMAGKVSICWAWGFDTWLAGEPMRAGWNSTTFTTPVCRVITSGSALGVWSAATSLPFYSFLYSTRRWRCGFVWRRARSIKCLLSSAGWHLFFHFLSGEAGKVQVLGSIQIHGQLQALKDSLTWWRWEELGLQIFIYWTLNVWCFVHSTVQNSLIFIFRWYRTEKTRECLTFLLESIYQNSRCLSFCCPTD